MPRESLRCLKHQDRSYSPAYNFAFFPVWNKTKELDFPFIGPSFQCTKLLQSHEIWRFMIVLYFYLHHFIDNSGVHLLFYFSHFPHFTNTSVTKYKGLVLLEEDRLELQKCIVKPKIPCAALTSLSLTGLQTRYLWVLLLSLDMTPTLQEELPDTQLISLSSMPSELYLVLNLTGFTFLSAWKTIQTIQSHTSTGNSAPHPLVTTNPTSHSTSWLTLLPSATPTWSCMVCGVLLPQKVSRCN